MCFTQVGGHVGGKSSRHLPEELKNAPWIIYAIEGNAKFDKNLKQMKELLEFYNHNVILMNQTLASTYNGTMTFFIDLHNKNNSLNSWGSSVFESARDVKKAGYISIDNSIKFINNF